MKTARVIWCANLFALIFTAIFSASPSSSAVGAAPTSGGISAAARLEALDGGRDLVGPYQALRPDGKNDVLFRLELDAPGRTLTGIELEDSAGRRAVWDTFPLNRTWLLAVARKGRLLNRPDGSLRVTLGQSREVFELWVGNRAAVKEAGSGLRLAVFFADGPVAAAPAGRTGGGPAELTGYLVEVTAQDIFIDRGAKHGVRVRERFAVLDSSPGLRPGLRVTLVPASVR